MNEDKLKRNYQCIFDNNLFLYQLNADITLACKSTTRTPNTNSIYCLMNIYHRLTKPEGKDHE